MQNWHSNTSVMEKQMAIDKSKGDQVDSVVCGECGKRIPKARLKIVPNTEFCVTCQAEYEVDHPIDDSAYLSEPDPGELSDIISPDD